MSDLERIQRDKATILSIIKYVLFLLIAALVIYYGFQLFWVLLPFVIGFILAKVANTLATGWKDLLFKIKCRRRAHAKRKLAQLSGTEVAQTAVDDAKKSEDIRTAAPLPGRRKRGHYPQGLARSRREIKLAVTFYVLEVIALIGLVVGVIIGSISQLRALANYLPILFRDTNLSQLLTGYLKEFSERFGGLLPAEFLQSIADEVAGLQEKLIEAMPGIASSILNSLGAFAGYLPILFFIIIVVIMSGYYFITDSRRLYVFLRRNITSKVFREKSVRLVNSLSTTLFRVIGGYLLLLIVTFIEALVGLLIIKMPYAVIIALVAAVVDFLPVLGVSATLIPVAIYMFVNGNIFGGLGALVLLAFMTLIRRVIEPAILGNAMSLHPMATLASMIIGIAIYGLSGIIIGPIILVIAKEVFSLYGFDKKIRKLIGDTLNKVSSD